MHHRIHVEETIEPQTPLTIRGDEFHHAARVVRVRAGEAVEVFDAEGHAAAGVVASIGSGELVVNVGELIDSRESPLRLTLAMSVIQLDRFELVLQKATELGIDSILPLLTERMEVRRERLSGKEERWRRIVFEAVKQCGRATIPRVEEAVTFDEAIARAESKIVFDADSETAGEPLAGSAFTLLIGPEGGFSERELAAARTRGCAFQRLGPRRLRAETAAIVACAVMQSRGGDLR